MLKIDKMTNRSEPLNVKSSNEVLEITVDGSQPAIYINDEIGRLMYIFLFDNKDVFYRFITDKDIYNTDTLELDDKALRKYGYADDELDYMEYDKVTIEYCQEYRFDFQDGAFYQIYVKRE